MVLTWFVGVQGLIAGCQTAAFLRHGSLVDVKSVTQRVRDHDTPVQFAVNVRAAAQLKALSDIRQVAFPLSVGKAILAAFLVFVFFGLIGGLLLGGLVSLRPDPDRMVEATREALEAGQTTVVVHAYSAEQRAQAAEFLRASGGNVTSTL